MPLLTVVWRWYSVSSEHIQATQEVHHPLMSQSDNSDVITGWLSVMSSFERESRRVCTGLSYLCQREVQ